MSESIPVKFDIQRFCPDRDTISRWQSYEVQVRPGMTLLDGLLAIREQLDPTLAWRFSCRMYLAQGLECYFAVRTNSLALQVYLGNFRTMYLNFIRRLQNISISGHVDLAWYNKGLYIAPIR